MFFKKIFILLISLQFIFFFSECKKLKMKLGIGYLIENPAAGTPEKVLQDVLRAISIENVESSWEEFVPLLHSSEKELPSSISNWRQFKFVSMRKKVDYLIIDKSKYSYKLLDSREEGESLILFVENKMSDMPTPCRFRLDPLQGNQWKIFNSCF